MPNCSRVQVNHLLDHPISDAEPVYLYQPRAEVVATAEREAGAVVVMARYLRLVDRGYRTLGEQWYGEHLADYLDPAPFRVLEISVQPWRAGGRTEANDRAAG